MQFLQKSKKALSSIDMFYSAEMLRYNKDTQYKTVTGGLMTIGIIVLVVIGFFSMISQTLNKTAITSFVTQNTSDDPTLYNLTCDSSHMFMFGLIIQPLDLTFMMNLVSGPRYFDLNVGILHSHEGYVMNLTDVTVEKCTDAHWQMLPGVVQKADKFLYDYWLCPTIGQTFPLEGSFTSTDNYLAYVKLMPCNNATEPDRPCAPQAEIDNLFAIYKNFYFAVNYINTVINPSQPDYLSYYLQGNDYVIFSATQGTEAWIYVSDYIIKSDNSIWPFQDMKTDVGQLVQAKAINHPFSVSDQAGYVNLYFSKSPTSLSFNRQVQKMSAVFSYIGGLVGAISGVLFLLKLYTDTSLQITIAMSLFKQQDKVNNQSKLKENQQKACDLNPIETSSKSSQNNQQQKQDSFSFISFLQLMAYKILKRFKFTNTWKKQKKMELFKEEIVHHLDIRNLLKRIIQLQGCISLLFDEYQLSCLKHQQKLDIQQVKKLRKQFIQSDSEQQQQVEQNLFQESQVHAIYRIKKDDPAKNAKEQIKITESQIISPSHLTSVDILKKSNKLKSFVSINQNIQMIKRISSNDKNNQDIKNVQSRQKISKKTMKSLLMLKRQMETNPINKKIWGFINHEVKTLVIDQQGFGEVTVENKNDQIKNRQNIVPMVLHSKHEI